MKDYILPPLIRRDVKIDKSFSVEEKKIIIKSLMMWQKATAGLVLFHIISTEFQNLNNYNNCNTIYILNTISSDDFVKIAQKDHKNKLFGFAIYNNMNWIVALVMDTIINKNYFKKVILHEIGHCLVGLPHLTKNIGIMLPNINTTSANITYYDLEMFVNNIKNII